MVVAFKTVYAHPKSVLFKNSTNINVLVQLLVMGVEMVHAHLLQSVLFKYSTNISAPVGGFVSNGCNLLHAHLLNSVLFK